MSRPERPTAPPPEGEAHYNIAAKEATTEKVTQHIPLRGKFYSEHLEHARQQIETAISEGKKVHLSLDFDDTMVFFDSDATVINGDLVGFVSTMLKNYGAENFEISILSSRPDDVLMKKINSNSKPFFVCFGLALALVFLPWLPKTNVILFSLRQFSAFADLILWIMCLHLAARAVHRQLEPRSSHQTTLVVLLFAHALSAFILLSLNYGILYFLDWNKQIYRERVSPGKWIRVQKRKISTSLLYPSHVKMRNGK